MKDDELTISELAQVVGVPLSRIKTMRARGQTAFWDAEPGIVLDDEQGRVWRRYTVTDAVALACVVELIERGLSADVAAEIVSNCRGHILAGPHPRAAARTDIFIGRVWFLDGQAHVGGQFCDLLIDIERRVRADIRDFDLGGGSSLFLVNASNHHRQIMEKLKNADL